MAYGTAAEVAALVKKYTDAGEFKTTTHPTLAQVGIWLNNVSAILDVLLAEQGFSTPITQASAKLALDLFAVEEAAALCEAANSSGRFFSERARETGAFKMILKDAEAFIESHSEGFEQLGATRTRHLSYGLDWCDTDDAGEEIEPIFDRKWMGQTH